MTEWLCGQPKNDEIPSYEAIRRHGKLNENKRLIKKIHEEFVKFERTVEELHLLRCVAEDLKCFRRMIRLKRYD